jgi:ABC-type nitrate/sulfonate/bicarbonate transport system substrate-binding protein
VVEDPRHLIRRIQMRLVRGERAVLAVTAARSRERQREIPAERDAASHPRRPFYGRQFLGLAASAIACAALAGCGSGSASSATLILDFTPNAVHAGIYAALANRYDIAAGVHLHIVVPTATTDSIKLLESGRVNFAVLDIHDLAIARERGADIVGVMAIVERPLAAVIAAPGISTPLKLGRQTVGITGVPSDTAVLDSIVAGAGGDPHRLRTITIGFNAVPDLLAGRVAAATAFWNDEGVTIRARVPGFHVFRVEQYGAPSYPELVLCATRQTLTSDPRLASGVVHALSRGYEFVLAHPASAAAALERQVAGLDPRLVAAQLSAELPAFRAADGRVGELTPSVLAAWARWEIRFGIVSRPPDVARTFEQIS